MAFRRTPLPAPNLPTCAQAALAIAIIQSKPADITVRDYIRHLREHTRPGQPTINAEDHGRYLDLVGYWQDQCRKAQEECQKLRSINIRLERSNQTLSQRTSETPYDERPSTASAVTSTKRKAPAPSKRAPKRPKPSVYAAAEQSITDAQEGIENDYDFLGGLGEDGASLLESLYTAHHACRATTTNAEALCHTLVATSSSLGKVIRYVTHNYEPLSRQRRQMPVSLSLGDDKSDFAHAMTVCARAFMSTLVGLAKLTDTSRDQRLTNLVICELAETFRMTLLAIESSALQTAQAAASAAMPPKKSKAKTPANTVRESIAARSLAHFLISLLGLLEKSNSLHQRLFESFAFLLFERVGKRLYYCTFGRHRSTSIEGNLLPLPDPQDAIAITKRDTEALGIRLELKALILILERAMGLAPHHMSSPAGKANNNSNRLSRTLSLKTLPSAPKARLSVIAKDRLQRTLVTCMYGGRADDVFLDVLTKPIPAMRINSLQNVAKIEDKDEVQWYKEEVWRLVGWDILAKEKGW